MFKMNQIYILVLVLIKFIIAQDYTYEKSANNILRINSDYKTDSHTKSVTPIPILKQINRHNEDGSYTYGYEGADGSFKIETKSQSGEVKGKYGYYDQTGKLRVVEYGADKHGFQPSGEGITVAPPTLIDETTNKDGISLTQNDENYNQNHEDKVIYRPQSQVPARFIYQQYSPQVSKQYSSLPAQLSPAPQQFPPSPQNYQQQSKPIEVNNYEQLAQYLKSVTIKPDIQGQSPQSQPQLQSQPQIISQQFLQQNPSATQYYQKPKQVGILDQLVKDYALPQSNSIPLHDISFGFY